MKRAMKVFTLVNFGLCLGGLIWLACSKEQGAATTPAPSNTAAPSTHAPALATLDDVVSCLEGEGGVSSDGGCVAKARVEGLEEKATLNDRYFAASKAAVPVTMSYRQKVDDFVHRTLVASCGAPAAGKPMPTQQAQIVEPPPPPSAEQLTCLRTELARRTHKR